MYGSDNGGECSRGFESSRGEVSLGPFYITYWAVVSRYLQSMVSEGVLGVGIMCLACVGDCRSRCVMGCDRLYVFGRLKYVLSALDVARKVWEETGIWGSGRRAREGTG